MPSNAFMAPPILQILSKIGLITDINREGILISASTIMKKINHALHKKNNKTIDHNLISSTIERAKALLQYLNDHWLKFKKENEYLQTEQKSNTNINEIENNMSWNYFVTQLKNICWVPVLQNSPHSALVWKCNELKTDDVSKYISLPTKICCIQQSWMVSASFAVMSVNITNEEFINDMNWNEMPSIKVIAMQLREEAKYINQLKRENMLQPQWQNTIKEYTDMYYRILNEMDSDDEMCETVLSILSHASIILVNMNTGFLPLNSVALSSNCDASPYLVVLEKKWRDSYEKLFISLLNIKPAFDVIDYISVLKQLYADTVSNQPSLKQSNHPLNDHQLNKVLLILDYLGNYDEISGIDSASGSNATTMNISTSDSVSISLANITRDANADEDEDEVEHELKIDGNINDNIPLYLKYGPIFIPNEKGILYESTAMVFNDAPWLVAMQKERNMIFVHSKITEMVARKLGACSFRNVFASNKTPSDKYSCTGAYLIRKKLVKDRLGYKADEDETIVNSVDNEHKVQPIHTQTLLNNLVLSMFEIADILGAHEFEVIIDDNIYPSQSILNENLTGLQGPSLLFRFDRALSVEQILNLQHLYAWSINSRVPCISPGKSLHFQQSGILPLYYLADCLLIVSGDRFVILDPAKQYLSHESLVHHHHHQTTGNQNTSNIASSNLLQIVYELVQNYFDDKNNTDHNNDNGWFSEFDASLDEVTRLRLQSLKGAARIFRFTSDSNSSPNKNISTPKKKTTSAGLFTQFPDQFRPFAAFGLQPNTAFRGTIIRIPLRTELDCFQNISKTEDISVDQEPNENNINNCINNPKHFSLSTFVCNPSALHQLPIQFGFTLSIYFMFSYSM